MPPFDPLVNGPDHPAHLHWNTVDPPELMPLLFRHKSYEIDSEFSMHLDRLNEEREREVRSWFRRAKRGCDGYQTGSVIERGEREKLKRIRFISSSSYHKCTRFMELEGNNSHGHLLLLYSFSRSSWQKEREKDSWPKGLILARGPGLMKSKRKKRRSERFK